MCTRAQGKRSCRRFYILPPYDQSQTQMSHIKMNDTMISNTTTVRSSLFSAGSVSITSSRSPTNRLLRFKAWQLHLPLDPPHTKEPVSILSHQLTLHPAERTWNYWSEICCKHNNDCRIEMSPWYVTKSAYHTHENQPKAKAMPTIFMSCIWSMNPEPQPMNSKYESSHKFDANL